ncbi:MAG: hypothetical protein DRR19_19260 [Candidatus Parabeggiatoa sp. nov. 1]|nr:MAG: hypothetical protein DRR19_19260 [Gammaproteobacteria bacterium]
MKQHILQLTYQKNISLVKDFIENLPTREKGAIFEWYLAELYQGNGWLTKIQGGRGDSGADILLYHPKTPNQVSLIVQAKNHAAPLTFDQTKIELVKFEQQAAVKYQCQQFNLVAVNGFVKEAQKLSEFNMLLSDWAYIAHLIEHFDPENITEPEIELFAHNKNAYEQVKALWQNNRSVAVVQATGTGKSLIIAKVMADFWGENQLLMAPSNYILEQQQTKVPWATQSIQFMTYAKGANLSINEINKLQPKLIILDEFHRCGAEVWGAGVQKVLKANPDAYVLGTTATPVRYLDGSRDMSDELFAGLVAIDLSLADAIVKRILPAPTYIAALYTLAEEINDLLELLKNSKKSDEEKQVITVDINQAKLDWERTSGIPEILKKHLTSDINKIIVFCKDKEHLDEMEVEVQRWFQRAKIYKLRKVYRVLSGAAENDENLAAFREAQAKNTVHLLFAINMLNEGLHIADVGAVILLRPTESPIIFYQQIGRCLQVDVEHTPIIFDFVNNFKSIRASEFLESLQEAKEREHEKRVKLGLEEYSQVVRIVDETKEIVEVFESVKERLQSWEVMFQQLVEFKEVHGHCNVPIGYENPRLATWVSKQRLNKKKETLNQECINKLNGVGFDWNPLATSWEKKYAMLVEYRNTYGNCNVPQGWSENKELATWVAHQRKNKQKGTLSEEYIDRLNKIGFVWNALESSWNEMYEALIEYKRIHGHCNVPTRSTQKLENPQLSTWIGEQRKAKRKGRLSEERIEKLNVIGFIWNPFKESWETKYAMLVEFVNKYGYCDVPFKWPENPQLSEWFFDQRKNKKRGKLNQERIEKLEKLGFEWNPLETDWDEMYEKLIEYKNIHGNCNVPNKYYENPQLGIWVGDLRKAKKRGKLSQERIDKLNKICFVWDLLAQAWEDNFTALIEFKKIYGHCNVPNRWDKNPKLGIWVQRQRQNNKKGEISKERIERLNKLEFVWEPLDTTWDEMFIALIKYKDENGHCNVQQRDLNNKQLGKWVHTQRKTKKDGKLSQERIEKLEKLGFYWNILETDWNEMYQKVIEYKNLYGNCNVPYRWSKVPKLGIWVTGQRNTRKIGKLSKERIEKLNRIGFIWNPSEMFEEIWEEMFETLVKYKNKYGHCNVPQNYSDLPKLAIWVNRQRQAKKKGMLSQEQIDKLNKISFIWNPLEQAWEDNFAALMEYKKIYGHCNVPSKWDKNQTLGMWVHHQRKNNRKGKLSQERIDRLNQIGFVWDLLAQAWEDNFAALMEYKKIYGHCNVPNRWDKNPKLGMWVQHQRQNKKKGKLSEERIQRLDAIGFIWNPKIN